MFGGTCGGVLAAPGVHARYTTKLAEAIWRILNGSGHGNLETQEFRKFPMHRPVFCQRYMKRQNVRNFEVRRCPVRRWRFEFESLLNRFWAGKVKERETFSNRDDRSCSPEDHEIVSW